ncbi:MAG TPA: hypothetical protein VEB61_04905 [Candidatus Binatia bacterium]|nr:hypothetical protein [Candidatus Binatia bacterium]
MDIAGRGKPTCELRRRSSRLTHRLALLGKSEQRQGGGEKQLGKAVRQS